MSDGKKQCFRKAPDAASWHLVRCKFCGSPAELWQEWQYDDVWHSFGACTNFELRGETECAFHLPPRQFIHERKTDAVRYWNQLHADPFEHAVIIATPATRRITMSFEKQQDYEAALLALDMQDLGRIGGFHGSE